MNERLIAHQTTVHEKEKPFKCEICLNSVGNKYIEVKDLWLGTKEPLMKNKGHLYVKFTKPQLYVKVIWIVTKD